MSVALLEELLRDPGALAARCRQTRELRTLSATALCAIAVGGMVFGAVVGSFRGSSQIALAAVKIPLATLAALCVSAPAFAALAAALGRVWSTRTLIALSLASGARASLVLFALAPVVWLAIAYGAGYDAVKLLAALTYAVAGLSALSFVVRALGPGPGRVTTALCFVGVFLVVGGQTAWLLRPYIGDPRDARVPLLATGAEGGGVAGALVRSAGRMGTP